MELAEPPDDDHSRFLSLMKNDERRVRAVVGIVAREGPHGEAGEDSKFLWQYLFAHLCVDVFSKYKSSIDKGKIVCSKAIMNTIDISDEALILLMLEIKGKEVVELVMRNKELDKDIDKLRKKVQDKKNESPGTTETEQETHKAAVEALESDLAAAVAERKKKGRKRRKTDNGGGDDASTLSADTDKDLDLSKHIRKMNKHTENIYKMREGDSVNGWHTRAWGVFESNFCNSSDPVVTPESNRRLGPGADEEFESLGGSCSRPMFSTWKTSFTDDGVIEMTQI